MTTDLQAQYLANGFVHLSGIFTGHEVATARHAVAHLPDWARQESSDHNIQRLQPLQTCPAVADPAWIKAFYNNPRLDSLVDAIFNGTIVPTPRMSCDIQLTGLLIEPREHWWSTGLHRDYRDLVADLDVAAWWARTKDLRLFNQVNIPLCPDDSLWVIPGSHDRADNTDEADLVAARGRVRDCREHPSQQTDAFRAELTDAIEACGAINIRAQPGDVVLYRSNILHCGVYEPGVERLTLHDGIYSREWHQYVLEVFGRDAATA
jgi:hypothetical protein